MASVEEDPKEVARLERKTPQAERLMKQFCKLESSVNASAYKAGYELAFANKCLDCDGWGAIGTGYCKETPCPTCDGTGKKIP